MKSMSNVELAEKLTSVISIQSEVINDLFNLLMQHIGPEEADRLPVVQKINQAAEIMRTVET